MDTLVRDRVDIDHLQDADELPWDVPTGILTHEPAPLEKARF